MCVVVFLFPIFSFVFTSCHSGIPCALEAPSPAKRQTLVYVQWIRRALQGKRRPTPFRVPRRSSRRGQLCFCFDHGSGEQLKPFYLLFCFLTVLCRALDSPQKENQRTSGTHSFCIDDTCLRSGCSGGNPRVESLNKLFPVSVFFPATPSIGPPIVFATVLQPPFLLVTDFSRS